jgi:ribosomal protein S18 acetylase RimI-like enzyme
MKTTVVDCHYSDPKHREAIAYLINAYIADDMGGGSLLTETELPDLLQKLESHPTSIVLLACSGTVFCGMLVAFENLSTFNLRPVINIHDLIVLPGYRNKGVGRNLLEAIVEKGKLRDCCRITLEVRIDNHNAQHLYKSMGFEAAVPDMYYWRKELS